MGIVSRLNGLDNEFEIFAGAAHVFHIRHHAEIDKFIGSAISGDDWNIIVHSRTYMKDMVGKRTQMMRASISSETFIWE